MKIKTDMFLDTQEEEDVIAMIKAYKKNPESDFIATGSLGIRLDREAGIYEVYTIRGHVEITEHDV